MPARQLDAYRQHATVSSANQGRCYRGFSYPWPPITLSLVLLIWIVVGVSVTTGWASPVIIRGNFKDEAFVKIVQRLNAAFSSLHKESKITAGLSVETDDHASLNRFTDPDAPFDVLISSNFSEVGQQNAIFSGLPAAGQQRVQWVIGQRRLISAIRRSIKIVGNYRGLGIVVDDERPHGLNSLDDRELSIWIRRNARTSHHPTSTCKMGPATDPLTVVDWDGRVHGVDGLHVADASIMPDNIRANTNLVSMVIGCRVASALDRLNR